MFGWREKYLDSAGRMRLSGGIRDEEMSCVPGGQLGGYAASTVVATHLGWRPVDAITVGDHVLTFDNGMQPVTAVTRGAYWPGGNGCPEHLLPIAVPVGLLGNDRTMLVPPELSIMIESDAAEELYGDPFVLIPAEALLDGPGVERQLLRYPLDVVTLHFEQDQVIHVDGGALAFCPAAVPGVTSLDFLGDRAVPVPYQVLDREEARYLVDCMAAPDNRLDPDMPVPEECSWEKATTHSI